MIDTLTPSSPGWWMLRLARDLESRQDRLRRLKRYHAGDPPLPEGARNAKRAYQAFQRQARLNLAELIAEVTRERLRVRAFRTAAAGDENGDAVAWGLWRANDMPVVSGDVHRNMVALGDAYVIVGQDELEQPLITGEDPFQVVTAHDPARRSRVVAALKRFHDPVTERDQVYLFLPGRRFVAYKSHAATSAHVARFSPNTYSWDPERGGAAGEELPFDVVPVVRFKNNEDSVGEFEPHLDVLDRINAMILNRMTIATMQAFRQRAIKIDDDQLDLTDDQGQPVSLDDVLVADPGAVWKLPASAELWESGQVDLTPVLGSVKDDIQHLAAVTRTPLSTVSPDSVNQSAEGAALSREGLVFKTEDKQDRAGSSWALVQSLTLRAAGHEDRADVTQLTVEWAPAERFSLAEKYDAAVKAKAAGVPWRTIMTEILQFSPEQVARMAQDRVADGQSDPLAQLLAVGGGGAPPDSTAVPVV